MNDVLDSFVVAVMSEEAKLLESRFEAVLQPRPRWLPEKIWRAIIRRLIVVRESVR